LVFRNSSLRKINCVKHVKKRKQVKNSFQSKNIFSTSKPLQLLHIDLFRPSRTMSLGDNYYGFVIVDDYSRFTWTLFLKTKNEAFDAFHKLAKVIQNEKGLNMKRMEFTTIFRPKNTLTK